MSNEPDQPPGVIRLVTRAEREAGEQAAYEAQASASAIRMLEEALEMARDQTERRVVGVAIAFSFSDRVYASHIPVDADNYGSLIAAVADAHYRLLKHTNGDR